MVEYIAFALLSILSAFAVEKIADCTASEQKFAFFSKINFKRFGLILVINLSVWLCCLLFHKTALLMALFFCIGFDILLCIAIEDGKLQKISNVYLIALLVTAVALTVTDPFTAWYLHIAGGAMGFLLMLFIRILGKAVKKQEVLGIGDVYVSGISGLMLGLQNYLFCGIITSIAALIAIRIIRRKKQYDKMHTYPLSPFFLLGYTVSMLFGSVLIEQYILWIIRWM